MCDKEGSGPVDRPPSPPSLDQLGVELVVEEALGVEAQDASGAVHRPDVGPGVAEGQQRVALGPAVEAALGSEVADVELSTAGYQPGKFSREQLRQRKRLRLVDGARELLAQLLDGRLERQGDGLVSEEADALRGRAALLVLLEQPSEVAQNAAQFLGLGVAVVVDEVAAGAAAPGDVEAKDAGGVADVEDGGRDRALERGGGGLCVAGGIEQNEGAAGIEEGRSLATPAGAVAEEGLGRRAREGVEAEEGELRMVSAFDEGLEPQDEGAQVGEPRVGGLAGAFVETEPRRALQGCGEKQRGGVEGARGEEKSFDVLTGRREREKLVERQLFLGQGQGLEDDVSERSERFVSVGREPASEALQEQREGLLFVGEGGHMVNEGGALIDDGEARKGGIVGMLEELARGCGEHVGEANVHVDLDRSGGEWLEGVRGAGPLGEGMVGALGARGAEKLTNGSEGSEALGQVEVLAEVLGGAVRLHDAKVGDALGRGGREAATVEVGLELFAQGVRGGEEESGALCVDKPVDELVTLAGPGSDDEEVSPTGNSI